jgi:hypothetical protein
VPQANTIARVLTLLDALFAGEDVAPSALGEGVSTPRQVAYYKQAARILGLLDSQNEPTLRALGLRGLAYEKRMELLAIYFEDSPVGRAWARWNNVDRLSDIDPMSAAPFLQDSVKDLGGTTIPRRASTLREWLADLTPFHYVQRLSKDPEK